MAAALHVNAAVETQAVAVFGFQGLGRHIGGRRLDGIEDVHAQPNEVRDERPDGAARVNSTRPPNW